MFKKISLNQFINAICFFAEKRLAFRQDAPTPEVAERGSETTTQKFFALLDKTAEHDEAQMDEQEKEIWLKEQKEKSTKEFRSNLEKSRSSLPSDLPSGDYEVADLFIKDLRSSYNTVDAQARLFYVDPAFDHGASVATGPKEDPLEIRVDINRGGGDTRPLPDYMWVKYKVVDGVPGVEVRWTEDKDISGNSSYNHVPLTTKEDAARISTLPKAKDMKIEGVEYLGMLKDGLGTDNPYAQYLESALENSKIDFSKVDVTKIVRKSDRLILKYVEEGAATESELEFGGYEYRAIFWTEISRNVAKVFKGKSVPAELMAMAARDPEKNPKFDKLVEAIAINPSKVTDGDPLANEAFAELEKLRPMLNAGGAKERAGVRSEMERSKVAPDLTKEDIRTLQLESGIGNKDFSNMAEDEMTAFGDSVDTVKREVLRENYKVDANQWRATDIEGLNRAYNEWSNLGIPVDKPFYKKLFSVLRDGIDPEKNPLFKNPQYAEYFKDPENHVNDIRAIRDSSDFAEAYATAIGFFMGVKQNILGRTDAQLTALDKQRKLDDEPITQKAIDVVRDNFNKFTKSIREGDYATAGLYVVGIWATYKALSSLFGGGGHGEHGGGDHKGIDWKKWAIFGVAGYAGYIFAKNAGYDVLKMAGIKRGDAEVAGTPLEAIPQIVAQLGLKEAEDLDYDVAARMSEVKVSDLYGQYQEANKHGIKFVHPNQFPQIFPDLKNVGFFDLGIGEKGLQDYEGNINKRLSTKQREYIRVGRQLYKLMLVIEKAYPSTMGKDTHMSFADALKDPTLKEAKIRHLFAGIGLFVNPASSEWGKSVDYIKIGELSRRELREAFDKVKGAGFTVESPSEEYSGGMKGTINGYPVVFLYDANNKRYQVYLANEFKKSEDMGRRTPIAVIPTEGGAAQTEGVKRAVDKVNARMKDLMSHLDSKYGEPVFDGSKWVVKTKIASMPEFGIDNETPMTGVVSTTDGKTLTITIQQVGIRMDINEEAMKANPEKYIIMSNFLSDPNFRLFNAFSKAHKLDIDDINKSAGTFKLKMLDVGNVVVSYERGVGYKMDPGSEQRMVQNETFGRAYIECLAEDKDLEFNKTIVALTQAIDDADQSFAKNLWDSLIEDGWSLGAFTGSIGNNLTESVIAVSRYETFELIRREMLDPKVTTLKDVESTKNSLLAVADGKLKNVIARLKSHDGNWEKHEFNYNILASIREVNFKSDVYARSKKGLESELYEKYPKHDFTKGPHKIVEGHTKTFAYYTAYLDTKGLDSVRSGVAIPPNAKSDPNYRPYFVYNYLKYVKENILSKDFDDPDKVPAPSDPEWGILEFNDYLNSPAANITSVDTVDNRPPLKHTLTLRETTGEGYTELDRAVAEKTRTILRRLQDEYGDKLKPGGIENYLTKDPTPEALVDPAFNPIKDAGLFSIYQDPTTRKATCGLWKITDKISAEIGRTPMRGDQEAIIDRAIQEYVIREIFQNSEVIFKDPQTCREWIAKNWPWMDRQIRRVGAWWDDDEPPEDTEPSAEGGRSYERYGA